MKKIIVMFLLLFIFIGVSTKAYACSCAGLQLDEYVLKDDKFVFTGKIYKVISKTKVIVEVENNLGVNPINKYVVVTSKSSEETSCGIDFSDYDHDIFVIGNMKNGEIRTNFCSTRKIIDGRIQSIQLGDTHHNEASIEDVKHYIVNVLHENDEDLGQIKMNSVNQVLKEVGIWDKMWLIIGIGVIITIGAGIILTKKVKSKTRNK